MNHSRFGSSCWCLRVASEELTEYVCYMNGMLYKNRELQVQPNKGCPSPRYTCWNEYYLERYGKNDPMIESQVIVDAKNKQSVDGDLFIHALEKVMIKHGFGKTTLQNKPLLVAVAQFNVITRVMKTQGVLREHVCALVSV